MFISGEERAVILLDGQPEDWCVDPVQAVLIHWTGLVVSLYFLETVDSQPYWSPLITSALPRYIDGLSEEDREHRQQRFQVWKEVWQFRKDFTQWAREKCETCLLEDGVRHCIYAGPGALFGSYACIPMFPVAIRQRLEETFQIDKDFRAWIRAHPLVMTCHTKPDGTVDRYEITDHPYAESYYANPV